MGIKAFTLLLLTAVFAQNSYAAPTNKKASRCNAYLEVQHTESLAANENYAPLTTKKTVDTAPFPPLEEAFPQGRGFLNSSVPINAANSIKAKTLGLDEWGIRIYPVSSEEEALQHYNTGGGNPNPLEAYTEISMNPWYLLLPNGQKWDRMTSEELEAYRSQPEDSKFDYSTWQYKKAIQQGAKLMYFHRDQISRSRIENRLSQFQEMLGKDEKQTAKIQAVIEVYQKFLTDPNFTKSDFYHYKELPIKIVDTLPADPKEDRWTEVPKHNGEQMNKLRILVNREADGEFFFQNGWFALETHGVIHIDDFLDRITAKKLRKFSKSLLNKGYRVTFNQNIRMVIEEAGEQVRGGKSNKGNSRFTEEQIQGYEELLRTGRGFSVEVWHPEGFLVGGTFGSFINGVAAAESVYYPQVDDPDLIALSKLFKEDPKFKAYENDPVLKNSIDFAKVSVLTLMALLKSNEVEWIDAGMVTPFTASMSGLYIWREEFMKMVEDAGIAAEKAKKKSLDYPPAIGSVAKAGTTPMKMRDFVKLHSTKQIEKK